MAETKLLAGDHAPFFICPSTSSEAYRFDTVAGRYIVLCFYGSMRIEENARAIAFIGAQLRHYFDDTRFAFFGVSIDRLDQQSQRVSQELPGIRYFWDFDHEISRLYGAIKNTPDTPDTPDTLGMPAPRNGSVTYHGHTLVLDPSLRVMEIIPLDKAESHNRRLKECLENLPPVDQHAGTALTAPVLIVPRVFEPSFCRRLITLYETSGGTESGFMRDIGGNTVGVLDHGFKRRKDCAIENEEIKAAMRARINRRVVPEIRKAFQFHVTHIERYIVACYEAELAGFFRPHRDNTTKATAHRSFACTINLNAEDYEGGDLRFPEFGSRTYRAPTGGAVVFSCSLLHEATPVTKGRRYATLPFFYDAKGALLREQTEKYLTGEIFSPGEDPTAAREA